MSLNHSMSLFYFNIALLIVVLFAISLLHFYWVFGGTWGFANTLPTKENGERLFTPKKIHSFIVGIGLLGIIEFLVFIFLRFSDLSYFYLGISSKWGFIFFGFIFLLRAIGDFKYVGFFKKLKDTPFGILDTRIYSPLCLLIACLFFMSIKYLPAWYIGIGSFG